MTPHRRKHPTLNFFSDEDEDLARAELDQELHASSPSSSLTALDDELGDLDDGEPEITDLSRDDLDDDSLEFAGDLDLMMMTRKICWMRISMISSKKAASSGKKKKMHEKKSLCRRAYSAGTRIFIHSNDSC